MDLSRPWVLRGIVIALAVVVGVVAYLATSGDGDEGPATTPAGQEVAGAEIVSEEELADAASTAETPVYWAGEIDDTQLELTEEEGSYLVRYLEEDDEVGAARAQRIAIGSYALPNPRKALNTFAETPGATVTEVDGIGKVVISPEAQKNVYFVDPDNEVQVEVYAPSPKRAMSLVRSGQVVPVG
ncbi:MAG: hypothetical protein WDZ46_10570 [Solirubrobacterales bacterium]